MHGFRISPAIDEPTQINESEFGPLYQEVAHRLASLFSELGTYGGSARQTSERFARDHRLRYDQSDVQFFAQRYGLDNLGKYMSVMAVRHVYRPDFVLDVGSGWGAASLAFLLNEATLRRREPVHLELVDTSADQLRLAKRVHAAILPMLPFDVDVTYKNCSLSDYLGTTMSRGVRRPDFVTATHVVTELGQKKSDFVHMLVEAVRPGGTVLAVDNAADLDTRQSTRMAWKLECIPGAEGAVSLNTRRHIDTTDATQNNRWTVSWFHFRKPENTVMQQITRAYLEAMRSGDVGSLRERLSYDFSYSREAEFRKQGTSADGRVLTANGDVEVMAADAAKVGTRYVFPMRVTYDGDLVYCEYVAEQRDPETAISQITTGELELCFRNERLVSAVDRSSTTRAITVRDGWEATRYAISGPAKSQPPSFSLN